MKFLDFLKMEPAERYLIIQNKVNDLLYGEPSKREKCIQLIKRMNAAMKDPVGKVAYDPQLNHLDFTILTDAQVDILYSQLNKRMESFNEACQLNGGRNIFQSVRELSN